MISSAILSRATAVLSAVFSLLLLVAYRVFHSDLALAQAADSLMDVMGGTLLAFASHVSAQPKDDRHPFGHSRAEPLGALAIAALATLLSFEVLKSAILSLLGIPQVSPDRLLFSAFLAKVVFKAVVYLLARGQRGAALEALSQDAKNDILVGAVAVLGFGFAKFGFPRVDAWLALPVGVYIGWAGVSLARSNVSRLMGEAPSEERRLRLIRLAGETAGVEAVLELAAHHLGNELSVEVSVAVDARLSVKAAHQLAERVRARLEAEPDVIHCAVLVTPFEPPGESGGAGP
jgi:ferrous-iron efflux pump FieF